MNIISIVSIIIYIICAVLLGLGIFFGIKKNLFSEIISIAFNAGAAVLSLLLSALILSLTNNFVVDMLVSFLSDRILDTEITTLLQTSELTDFIGHLSKAALSIIFVPLLYIIIRALLQIPAKIVGKKECKLSKKILAATIAIRIVSVLITITMVFGPASAIISAVAKSEENTIDGEGTEITGTISPLSSNVILNITGNTGGKAIISLLSDYKQNGQKIHIDREITDILTLVYTIPKIYPVSTNDASKEPLLYQYTKDAFNDSDALPPIAANIFSDASSKWIDGKAYLGFKFKVPSGRQEDFYQKMYTVIGESDENNINDNFNTVIDMLELISKSDGFKSADKNKFITAFSDEDFTTDFFSILYDNENFRSLIPEISYTALASAFDQINVSLPSVEETGASFDNMTKEDALNDAVLLSNLADVVLSINEKVGSMDIKAMSWDEIKELCSAVTALKDSYFLHTYVKTIITGIMNEITNSFSSDIIINSFKATFSEYISATE